MATYRPERVAMQSDWCVCKLFEMEEPVWLLVQLGASVALGPDTHWIFRVQPL